MREKLYRFMQGRYGADDLNKLLIILMIVCLVLSMFLGNIFYVIGAILLLVVYFRMFSRNIYKRSAENQRYLRYRNRVRDFLRGRFKSGRNTAPRDPAHRVFLCPSCKQKIRVPKGKGKIAIRCPKCGKEFIKRT